MIPALPKDMPLRVQLKFFRTQAQRLRRTADFISSEFVSSQCAAQIQTCAHLLQRNQPSKLPLSTEQLQARFVNHNLFSVAGASGAMAASRPPLLWHRCWAWDSLSSTTRLLSGRSPLDQSSGFSHSTTVFSVATLLGASADRSKRGLVAISTSALPVRAGPRDCRHSLGGNSPPGNKENGSRQAVRCARAT